MTRRSLFNLSTILCLVLAMVTTFARPSTISADPGLSLDDMFVVGSANNSENDAPILFRMDGEGAILWDMPLPFEVLWVQEWAADRNLSEDSFYMVSDSYHRNQIDGKDRILKFAADGSTLWDIPFSPEINAVSANPKLGGAYASDLALGVYRIDTDGNMLWGPESFGIPPSPSLAWSVATDVADGGAFVGEASGTVRKIDAQGNVLWVQSVPEAGRLNPSLVDGGVYVGAGSYSKNTYKLAADGAVEWVKYDFPSPWTYPRAVDPFDGSLFIHSGWPARFVKVTVNGDIVWDLYDHLAGPQGLVVDIVDREIFAGECYENLGITMLSGADGSVLGRTDPGYYSYGGEPYGPWYRPYIGTPVPGSAATISAIPDQPVVYPGDAVAVDLEIQGAVDLYAAQVEVATDPAILEPQTGVFGGFFDPVHCLVAANEVDPEAGTWLGAISQQRPAEPLTGDGLLATVTYQALAPGTTALAGEPLLSSRDGFALPVSFSGTDVTVLPFGLLSGTVTYQGRLAHEGIEVTAAGPVTVTKTTGDDGGFLIQDLKGGDYVVTADAVLYLPTCTTASVSSGEVTVLGPSRLLGGDLNDDGCIEIGDATLLTANFGQVVPPADPRADVNGDGVVNVQDLAILAGNYELCGCQDW